VSRAQRLTFLAIAVVIAIVAVLVLTSAGSDEEEADTTRATATPTATAEAPEGEATETPTATPTPTPTPTPKPQPPLLRAGKVTDLRFTEGETVRFRVRSDTPEEIHVHGYDITEEIPPGDPTTVTFPAEITGIFEIEFHGSGEVIGELRVDPD
jgi:FtsP/CotA-like multicopper oxidase with cupredoxin domain